MTSYSRGLGRAAVAAAFAVSSGQTMALEYGASIGYLGEYTDNVRRSAEGEESDVIHRPYVSAVVEHLGPRLELGANYRLQRRIYQDDTYDEQDIAEGGGQVYWQALPRHLTLFATDQRRETEIRTAEVSTPDNLQKTNRSSVGATLSGNLIGRNIASLTYEFIVTETDETLNDSDRDRITAAYRIPRSSAEYFELSASRVDTDFDNPLAPDYRADTGSVAWDRTTTLSHILVRVGYTEVERDLDRDSVSSMIGDIELSRTLSDQSIIQLSYSRTVDDNSLDAGSRFIDLPGDVFVGDTDLSEVFTADQLALTYTTNIGASSLSAVLFGAQDDYEDVARDTERYGAELQLVRSIRPNLATSALVRYERYRFDAEDVTQNQYNARVGLDWQATRRLNLNLFGAYHLRENQATDEEIDEWRVGIEVDLLLLGSLGR